jgi:hypothetical protein
MCTTVLLGLTACSVSTNKNNGGDNVRIRTPFGGLHVQSNQTSAADIGLPAYPGATLDQDKDNSSADVNMSFGSFHLKVLTVTYQTPDGPDKIFDFYRKGLAQYGDVLECDDNKPVGKMTKTSSGLTCSDDAKSKRTNIQVQNSGSVHTDGHQLRAGSPADFRLVEIDTAHPGYTKFGMVYLQLPHGDDDHSSTN